MIITSNETKGSTPRKKMARPTTLHVHEADLINKYSFRINGLDYNQNQVIQHPIIESGFFNKTKNLIRTCLFGKSPMFPSNEICTSKYTWINFLPKNLMEQFLRFGNMYFLLIVCIQMIPTVSPFPWWTSVLPLLFILGVSALKQGVEDYFRHQEDDEANSRLFQQLLPSSICISGGSLSSLSPENKAPQLYTPDNDSLINYIQSKHIQVGMILCVHEGQEFPADMILLSSSNADGTCYINTANLDGEAVPKLRVSPEATLHLRQSEELSLLRGEIRCDPPTPALDDFQGRLEFARDKNEQIRYSLSVTMERLLHEHIIEQEKLDFEVEGIELHEKKDNENDNIFGEGSTRVGFPLSDRQFLLRGAKLVNTKYIYGVVCFTGEQTKMMMNRSQIGFKFSRFETNLNQFVLIAFIIHLILCVFAAICFSFLDLSLNANTFINFYSNISLSTISTKDSFYSFLTVYILFSFMIPMSLYVTVEIIRLIQLQFMQWDQRMMYWEVPDDKDGGHKGEWAPMVVKNSALNEELGKIDFVFSDKTGTLTQNIMQLSTVSVGEIRYYNMITFQDTKLNEGEKTLADLIELGITTIDEKNEEEEDDDDNDNDSKIDDAYCAKHFLLTLLLNNSVLPVEKKKSHDETMKMQEKETKEESYDDDDDDDQNCIWNQTTTTTIINEKNINNNHINNNVRPTMDFQSQSPDEIAFVSALHVHNITLLNRFGDQLQIQLPNNNIIICHILAELEFSSSRSRMSVVVKLPNDQIMLYVKGADSTVLPLCTHSVSEHILEYAEKELIEFSKTGKRTLVMAGRELSYNEYNEWRELYEAAQTSLGDRKKECSIVFEKIEQNLIYFGSSGIEDELQEYVRESIQFLLEADIKVMILTGDKKETAVTIARNIGMIPNDVGVVYIDILIKLSKIQSIKEAEIQLERARKSCIDHNNTLAISGRSLEICLTHFAELFFNLVVKSKSVVCFRCTPSHKALTIIHFKKFHPENTHLAIGDGANDVSMIQQAHVGVGIRGREGGHAALSSDYVIFRFHHLITLLAIQGRYSKLRTGLVVFLSFYKNFVMPLPMWFYLFYCGFTGQILFTPSFLSFFNLLFLSLAPFGSTIFEQDIKPSLLLRMPKALSAFRNESRFTATEFLHWLLVSCWHALLLYFLWMYIFQQGGSILPNGNTVDIWYMGDTMFTIMLILLTFQFLASSSYHTVILYLSCIIGLILYFGWFLFISVSSWDPDSFHLLPMISQSPLTWLYGLLVCVTAAIPSFTLYAYKFLCLPTFTQELQYLDKFGPHDSEGNLNVQVKCVM